jgi:autophagy-related protein 9
MINTSGNNNDYFQIKVDNNKKKNINSVEIFLKNIYSYYYKHGYWNIIIEQIVDIVGLIFTLIFSIIIFMFLDWGNILKCSMKKQQCNNIINNETWKLNGFYMAFVSTYIAIISLILIGNLYKFYNSIKKFNQVNKFYRDILKLKDDELNCTDWKYIVERLVKNQLYFNNEINLNASKILNLIMRKENYLIALIESDIFPLKIGNNIILTKMMEWIIYNSIINTVCDINFFSGTNNSRKIENILSKRFKLTGVLCLIISPFLLIFMFIYIILIYGNKYHTKSSESYRQWNKYALCKFREYNELPHLFEERISRSIKYSHNYILSFNTSYSSRILQLISFMVSAMLVTILTLGFLNEDLMTVHLGNRALAWYAIFLGIILTVVKLFDFDVYISKPKSMIIGRIKEFTRYVPESWEENPKSYNTHKEFITWFQPTIIIYIIELLSVIILPILLLLKYKNFVKDITYFIIKNTVYSHDDGIFVKMSVIDKNQITNSDQKMERSILGFNNYYNRL